MFFGEKDNASPQTAGMQKHPVDSNGKIYLENSDSSSKFIREADYTIKGTPLHLTCSMLAFMSAELEKN